MSTLNHDVGGDNMLAYKITHVFCPLRLPSEDDHSVSNDRALAEAVCASARAFAEHVSVANKPQWNTISNMLANFSATMRHHTLEDSLIISQMGSTKPGGTRFHHTFIYIRSR